MTLFDPGLQPERTALAWRRTALTLAAGAVVSARLLSPVLGGWSLVAGAAGLLSSVTTWTLAGRRARHLQSALLSAAHPLPGGGLPLLLALMVAGGAVLGLLYTAATI